MSLPNNPSTEYLLERVPLSLLEEFYAEKGDMDLLVHRIKTISLFKQYRPQKLWELQILTNSCGNYQEWTVDYWAQRENLSYKLSPLLYSVLLGKLEVLNWLAENKPDILKKEENEIAYWAAKGSSLPILQWLYHKDKNLINTKDNLNIAHIAASEGSTAILNFVAEVNPGLLQEQTYVPFLGDKCNLAHFAAGSPDTKTLEWVNSKFPEFFNEQDNDCNPAFHAALSGNVEALEWFLKNKPELLAVEDKFGYNIAYSAAKSGNPKNLEWVIAYNPTLHTKFVLESGDKVSVLDYAYLSQSKAMISYLINEYPEFCKELFAKGLSLMTHQFIPVDANHDIHYEVRDEILLEITRQVITHTITAKEIRILNAFKNDWQRLIIFSDDFNADNLVKNKVHFPIEFQEFINKNNPIFTLKKINCKNENLTIQKFQQLLQAANQLFTTSQGFFKNTQPSFLQKLNKFNLQLNSEQLSDTQIACLKLIINDYKNRLLGPKKDILDLLILKLEASNQFPKSEEWHKLTQHEQFAEIALSHKSFKKLVKEYVESEYLPYVNVMKRISEEEAKRIDPAYKFIIKRHQYDLENAPDLRQMNLSSRLRSTLKEDLEFQDRASCLMM